MQKKDIVLVSACLLGVNCRYDGTSKRDPDVLEWVRDKVVVPVCPELLSGLGFPRLPAEIEAGDGYAVLSGKSRVLLRDGRDVTREFLAGAKEALKIAKLHPLKLALLKEMSPSCGVNYIYNHKKRVRGVGIFCALLMREGYTVISETDLAAGKNSQPSPSS